MNIRLCIILALIFIQCKPENSFNSVVKEAAVSEENLDQNEKVSEAPSSKDIKDPDLSEPQISEPLDQLAETEESRVLSDEVQSDPVETKTVTKKRRGRSKIEFDDIVYQFGEIESGDIVEHKFYFTNVGSAPLNIKSTEATCGCTVPSYPFIPIDPGDRGYIGVTFNSVGKSGKQTPTITVISNASDPIQKLRMSGMVVEEAKKEEPTADSTSQLPE